MIPSLLDQGLFAKFTLWKLSLLGFRHEYFQIIYGLLIMPKAQAYYKKEEMMESISLAEGKNGVKLSKKM